MKFLILLLLCQWFSIQSRADILFLDLNASPGEVAAAKKAAAQRGEKLIVFPTISASVKAELTSLNKSRTQLSKKEESCRSEAGCDPKKISDQIQAIMQKSQNIRKPLTVNSEALKKKLNQLQNQKVQLSSLVISGHDGNGHFGGEFGDFHERQISEAFADAAPLGENIRSLMLWGCYTTNIGSLTNIWKKTLPQVEMIAGYDASAPLGDKPGSWTYLEDALIQEQKMTKIKDEKVLQKAFKSLRNVPQMNAALCVGDQYVSNKRALKLSEAKKLCGSLLKDVQNIYACYMRAEKPNCENPPQSTSSSELRAVYNKLQEGRHCYEVNQVNSEADMPSPDVVIRLIFFKQVKENFARLGKDAIQRFNELLEEIQAPAELKIENLSAMSRSEVLAKLNALKDYTLLRQKEGGPLTPEIQALTHGLYELQSKLGDLQYVPFSWIEPNAMASREESIMAAVQPKSVERLRQHYEGDRARSRMAEKIQSLLLETPATKEKVIQFENREKQLTQEYQQLWNQYAANSSSDPLREKLSAINKERHLNNEAQRAFIHQAMTELKPQVEQFRAQLEKEDYPHAQGKAAFNAELKAMDIKEVSNNMAYYLKKPSDLQILPIGGGLMSMGVGMGGSVPAGR